MKFLVAIYNVETLKQCGDYIDSAVLMVPHFSQIYDNSFNLEEALKICEEKKIVPIIAINKLITEGELSVVKEFIEKYKKYDFLAMDLGLLNIFKELNMMDKVIYDSSTMVCNSLDLGIYSSLGLNAISMSNEIPVCDVIKGYNDTKANIMYQVFGRKQMFYSKRKLISCYEDYRNVSIPRNNLYIKEEKRIEKMPVFENDNGFFVYRSYFISLLKEMQNLQFLKYAYFETLTLNNEELIEILKAFKENKPELLNKLNLDIQDGFAYLDTIHVKEKIINEKN